MGGSFIKESGSLIRCSIERKQRVNIILDGDEDKDILISFLYKVYCRHSIIDFSYLGEFSGGLHRHFHKRYLDESRSDPRPGAR